MPFTISHIALIYPFRKLRLVKDQMDALVLGCVMPDLIYFFPVGGGRDFSHSLEGLLFFSLPASLICLLLFRFLLKDPLFSLLPGLIQVRINLRRKAGITFKSLILSVLFIVLGILSHLLWDAFTHGEMIFGYFSNGRYNFYLQFYSSALGMAILLFWIGFKLYKSPVHKERKVDLPLGLRIVRSFTLIVPLALSALSGLLTMESFSKRYIAQHFSMWIMFGGGFLLLFFIILYSVLFFVHKGRSLL